MFRIWVCDALDAIKSKKVAVARLLESWLQPIAVKAKFPGAQCVFPQYIVNPQPHEVLVYVCPANTSVVQKMNPGGGKPHMSSQHMGVTFIQGRTGSEIWSKGQSVEGLASLIFHEAMHNKLQLDNAGLHNKFLPQCSLSCASINWFPGIKPSDPEAAAMSAALRNSVPQWTDGQAILRDARLKRKANDPLWDIGIN